MRYKTTPGTFVRKKSILAGDPDSSNTDYGLRKYLHYINVALVITDINTANVDCYN